eukprot:TRINITY_DN1174_c1_g1_i1.p1 TRINITY_DN1174_c1_g1~~TRINITY_DN1174_c1_g1_i1.p1  ORF type:complete len:346 (-),score=59.99 TRINITY_DN1174_c1_g1_i1:28-1065(-)
MSALPLDSYVVQAGAFSLLCYDVYKGRSAGFSVRTLVALTLTDCLSFWNLPPQPELYWQKALSVAAATLTGFLATLMVARCAGLTDDDSLCSKDYPIWLRESAIYLAILAVSVFAVFASCHFSIAEAMYYTKTEWLGPLCTVQNFANAIGLLPQLVLCRRRGSVPPAVVRFLLIIGCKQAYEFCMDFAISYDNYVNNRFSIHEACFMSGDLIAAVLLADFYYMVASSKSKVPLFFGNAELPLSMSEDSEYSSGAGKAPAFTKAMQIFANLDHSRRLTVYALMASMSAIGLSVAVGLLSMRLGVFLVVIVSIICSMYETVSARFAFARRGNLKKTITTTKEEKLCV